MLSLNISATGMSAQQTRVDTIAQNLANMNSTAYKSRQVLLSDLAYITLHRAGTNTAEEATERPSSIDMGLGSKVNAVYTINTQGELQYTGNSLDIAISGEGYFPVTDPEGNILYTRLGAFTPNRDGVIVTVGNGLVLGNGIQIPNNIVSLSISNKGIVIGEMDNEVEPIELGRINLVKFINSKGLKARGNGLFQVTNASGEPIEGEPGDDELGLGELRQHNLEGSNIDAITEMTSLIAAQRAYEMNSNVMQTSSDMLKLLNNVKNG